MWNENLGKHTSIIKNPRFKCFVLCYCFACKNEIITLKLLPTIFLFEVWYVQRDLSKGCLVACLLKEQKSIMFMRKFRKPAFRFELFETSDTLFYSFSEFITLKLLSLSDVSLLLKLDARFLSATRTFYLEAIRPYCSHVYFPERLSVFKMA